MSSFKETKEMVYIKYLSLMFSKMRNLDRYILMQNQSYFISYEVMNDMKCQTGFPSLDLKCQNHHSIIAKKICKFVLGMAE